MKMEASIQLTRFRSFTLDLFHLDRIFKVVRIKTIFFVRSSFHPWDIHTS